jgi:hypothetical protein
MYCPQCATSNTDGVKFCRSCGLGLERLALALGGELVKPGETAEDENERRTWAIKQTKGVKDITGGLVLMLVSLLIGCAMALFLPAEVPWMVLWMIFFGWMACWGGIELAGGVGRLLEAKGRLRLLDAEAKALAPARPARSLSPAGDSLTAADSFAALKIASPASVTEGTTRHLDERVEK